ncbi:hypothetical protein GCM10020331_042150 [Ectobacillus funiculus]
MKVGDIIDRLNGRESLVVLAKRLGMMPHTLSKKLRLFGYEYDSKKRKKESLSARERSLGNRVFFWRGTLI